MHHFMKLILIFLIDSRINLIKEGNDTIIWSEKWNCVVKVKSSVPIQRKLLTYIAIASHDYILCSRLSTNNSGFSSHSSHVQYHCSIVSCKLLKKNCTSTQIHLKCILIPFFPSKMTRKCVRIYFVTFSSHSQWLSTCPFFNKNFSQVTIYYLNISSIYVYLTYLSYLLQKKCERQLVLCLHYYSFYYRYIPTTHLIIFAAILIWTTQFKCFLFIESWDNETLLSITTKMVHGNI